MFGMKVPGNFVLWNLALSEVKRQSSGTLGIGLSGKQTIN